MTEPAGSKKLFYKRSHFVTHLPVDYLYSPSHFWLAQQGEDEWRVGLTKFATRMLGELVDHGFEVAESAPVQAGRVIGWIEGFKAISDVYCVADGRFGGGNPALQQEINLMDKEPYGGGWLYRVQGKPDSRCMDVHSYQALLDKTIDRILEKQKADEGH